MTQRPHTVMDETTGGRFLALLRRRGVEVLTALYLATVVYNSLVPLDFSASASEIEGVAGHVLGLPIVGLSIPDAASNVAFYVPLGILLCATLVRAGWGRWLAIIPTVLVTLGLSYLMELVQTWSPTRISSAFDCLYNLVGASCGAVVSCPLVLLARHLVRRFTHELRDRPSLVLTGALGFGLAFAALLPMDITFSVNRLHQAAKSAHWVPFEKLAAITELHSYEGEKTAYASYHLMLRDRWMLGLDYVTWSILYATLALVGCYYLRTHCRMDVLRAAGHALGMCAVYSIGSSALQFFVMSRGLDVTVPLFQMGGASLGALLQPLVLRRAPGAGAPLWPLDRQGTRRLVLLGLVVVIVSIGAREMVPFRFETSVDSIADQIKATEWLPGKAYQTAKFHSAVDDVVRKVLRFAALGALVAAAWSLRRNAARALQPWRVGAWVALATGVFETLQLLLPSRVPGVTDVLLAWFGTSAGVYLCQLGRLWWYETRGVAAEAEPIRIDYRVELGERRAEPASGEPAPTPKRPSR